MRNGPQTERLALVPSDDDRADAIERLRKALAADRLRLEEFETWAAAIYGAATLDDLRELTATLPANEPRRAHVRGRLLVVGLVVLAGIAGFVVLSTNNETSMPAAPSCAAANTVLRTAKTGESGSALDRLVDAVPPGAVEGYRQGTGTSFDPRVEGQRPWLLSAAVRHRATAAYAATFNRGPPGPGGWTLMAIRYKSPADARDAMSDAYRSFVCEHDAEPFVPANLPALAAYRVADVAEISFTHANTVMVVQWSIFQGLEEAKRRAVAVADVVRQHVARS